MTRLHFNYKDIFRACRLGFSAKKIWMMFLGFLIAFLGYTVASYIAYLVNGFSLAEIWNSYRLLPFPEIFPWYSWIIWFIGIIFSILVILITGTAVVKVTFEQLREDEFFEIKEAFKFSLQNWRAVIFSPTLVLLFALSLVVCGLILSLLGAIPYAGEIFVGIMAIPAFAVSLFIVYLLIVFIFTLLFTPAVVGFTKNDTFDTIFEVFSCVNEQPWRLIWYSVILWILAWIALGVLGLFSSYAFQIGSTVVQVFMGGKLLDVLDSAAYYLTLNFPNWFSGLPRTIIEWYLNLIGMGGALQPGVYNPVNWGVTISGFLVGIAYYVVILFVLAYGGAVFYSGSGLLYSVLVNKKDEKNLLEVSEREEVPEPKPEEETKPEEVKEEKERQPE